MKPPPFDYVAARSVDHAVELINGTADARVMAGGQSLMPLMNLRLASPDLVVDIGRIPELRSITVDDGTLVIGAGVTQSEAASDRRLRDGWPILAAAIDNIGHTQIRNRGTVCGSLAHNDPLAELPAVALALDATLVVAGPGGERMVRADEMFVGPFMTSLDEGELVVAARFGAQPNGSGWSVCEFAIRPGDFATVGVVTRLTIVDGIAADVRVVLFGVGPGPIRSTVVEQAVAGSTTPDLDSSTLDALDQSINPGDDAHASGATRRRLAADLVSQSIAEAWERSQ